MQLVPSQTLVPLPPQSIQTYTLTVVLYLSSSETPRPLQKEQVETIILFGALNLPQPLHIEQIFFIFSDLLLVEDFVSEPLVTLVVIFPFPLHTEQVYLLKPNPLTYPAPLHLEHI